MKEEKIREHITKLVLELTDLDDIDKDLVKEEAKAMKEMINECVNKVLGVVGKR